MDQVELLTVEDSFELSVGLVIVPDFDVPARGWKAQTRTVTIIAPDGRNYEATAHLGTVHFNIPDPAVGNDRRWRIVVSFPSETKQAVPIGSKIMVPPSLKSEVHGES